MWRGVKYSPKSLLPLVTLFKKYSNRLREQLLMVTSFPYSNPTRVASRERLVTGRGPTQPPSGNGPYPGMTEPAVEEPRVVSGSGALVMYGTRLDVDRSVRISDLLTRIENLLERVERLESVAGVSDTPEPTNTLRIGVWQLIADGTKLLKQVDLNAGLTVEPVWETREENDL